MTVFFQIRRKLLVFKVNVEVICANHLLHSSVGRSFSVVVVAAAVAAVASVDVIVVKIAAAPLKNYPIFHRNCKTFCVFQAHIRYLSKKKKHVSKKVNFKIYAQC